MKRQAIMGASLAGTQGVFVCACHRVKDELRNQLVACGFDGPRLQFKRLLAQPRKDPQESLEGNAVHRL